MTFNLYNNPNGTGTPLFTDANLPLSGGVATSTSYTTTATGSDYWVATYNGNGNNASVSSSVAAELVTVGPATPAISTTVSTASIVVGGAISDSATVSGGYSPSGTVTFNLYNNPNGTGTPLLTDANQPLSGGVATSTSYTTTATGSDYWVATYNGNGNNTSVSSGVAAELVTVGPATPAIGTTVSTGSIVVGGAISDSATVSGGYSPSGTVTFNLYNNPNGTGTPLFTDASQPLSGGVATSTSYTTTATGSDYWVATYNGNGNNTSVSSGVAAELVTVGPATPAISTTVSTGSIVVGGAISDSATVSGGYSPSGTVTFNLYNNPNGTGTPLFTDANQPLSGGVATSTSYTTTATGTDYWVATYNGNGNNVSVSSGAAAEPVTVGPATPTISGTKFDDLTGNGFSADDTGLGGATIDLYKESNGSSGLQTGSGGDTLVATTTTASNGAYSFSNLPSGTYYVQEAVPSGYIQTGGGPNGSGGDAYYTVGVQSGQTYTGYNFDDYLVPTCSPTNVSYVINGCTTVSSLGGHTAQGDTVTVTFTVSMTEQLTLVVTLRRVRAGTSRLPTSSRSLTRPAARLRPEPIR